MDPDKLATADRLVTSLTKLDVNTVIAALEQEVASDDAQRARFSARAADSTSGDAAHPREP